MSWAERKIKETEELEARLEILEQDLERERGAHKMASLKRDLRPERVLWR
jgi:hypothetical protein